MLRLLSTLFIAFLSSVTLAAEPSAVRDHIRDAFFRSMYFVNSENPSDRNLVAYFKVFIDGNLYQGFGSLKFEAGSALKETKDQVYIEMDDRKFYPEMTDSIVVFEKVGIPEEDRWLFKKSEGKISTFSDFPMGPPLKIAVGNGVKKPINQQTLEKVLANSPLAFAHIEADPEFAIRTFNKYSEKDIYKGNGTSVGDLRKIFFSESLGGWEMSKIKNGDPNGLIEISVKARYLCQNGKPEEAMKHIEKLKSIVPEFYSVHTIEASCFEKIGKYSAALNSYKMARGNSPNSKRLSEFYNKKINYLKWKIGNK